MPILFGSCALAPVALDAHHSGSEYDRTIVEIEGELLEVAWQNPHVHFFVRAADQTGKPAMAHA